MIFSNNTSTSELKTSHNQCDLIPLQENIYAQVILSLIDALLAVLAVLGNLAVIYAVKINTNLHSCTYALVVNLAISDFLTGLIAEPLNIAMLVTDETRACFWEQFDFFWESFPVYASCITLAFISIDRCISFATMFKNPLLYDRLVNKTSSVATIIITWIISFGMSVFPIVDLSTVNWYHNLDLGFFVAILGTMAICYIYIYRVAKKEQFCHIENTTLDQMKRNKKIAKTMAVIILAFVLSWLPYVILNQIWIRSSEKLPGIGVGFSIVNAIGLGNSAVNPWLYFWKNRDFRTPMKECFRKVCGHFCFERYQPRSSPRPERSKTIMSAVV